MNLVVKSVEKMRRQRTMDKGLPASVLCESFMDDLTISAKTIIEATLLTSSTGLV
jgi:hypothetical protein